MASLSHQDIINILIALSIILIGSRLLAELFKKFNLPTVLGEIIFGILIGPTIFGYYFPETFETIFPFISENSEYAQVQIGMGTITELAIIMLLFVAGLEVQLPVVIRQGKVALTTTLFGMLVPIAVGFLGVLLLPEYLEVNGDTDIVVYGFFIGVILSITALPVIARILMDLKMFKTEIGMVIIASAMLIDLLGWLVFSVLLTMMDASHDRNVLMTIISVVIFMVVLLTIGTKLFDKALPWIQSKFSWPGGVLSISLGLAFLGAAFTESIGIHSILGSFIVGVMIGDSSNLRENTREIIMQFVMNIFAPLFFVSIGLYINFIESFDFELVLTLLFLAYLSKISGATLGARLGGMPKKESFTIGMAMNTHGALEIILGSLALNMGFITQEFFVAIVVMVVVSILTAAPLIRLFPIEQEKLK